MSKIYTKCDKCLNLVDDWEISSQFVEEFYNLCEVCVKDYK